MKKVSSILLLTLLSMFAAAATKTDLGIVFAEYGDEKIKLNVHYPEDAKDAPVIFNVHGGGWASGDENRLIAIAEFLSSKGYVVVSPTYRKVTGTKPKWKIADCVADVEKALNWTIENAKKYGGNSEKLGVIGGSAGAHLAGMMSVLHTDKIKCAVPMDFPADLKLMIRVVKRAGEEADVEKLSPISLLKENSKVNYLLIHARGDKTVLYKNSTDFKEACEKLNIKCELMTIENNDHGFWNRSKNKEKELVADKAYEKILEFLDKNLKK